MTTFDHVHICCSNLNAMINLWMNAFDAEFVRLRKFGTADGAVLTLAGTQIFLKEIPAMSPQPDASACGLNHLGVRVDNPNAVAKILVDKFNGRLINKASEDCSFVSVPDGLTFELMRTGAII